MSDSPDYARLERLEEDNYRSWLVTIRAHLRSNDLWKYTEKRPEGLDPAEDAEWEYGAMKAADVLTPTISSSIKSKLLYNNDYDDAYKMMIRLNTHFRPTGEAEFMRLTKELYSVKYHQFRSVTEYATHIRLLKERIEETDVKMSDDMEYLLLYSLSLPEQYQPLVKIWSVTPDMTAERALRSLLNEERRLQQIHKDEKESEPASLLPLPPPQPWAPASRKRTLSDMRAPTAPARGYCRTCKKPHSEETCWKLHPELAPDWLKAKKIREVKEERAV